MVEPLSKTHGFKMNKLMISMLTLSILTGVTSTESFAKQRRATLVSCAEKNAVPIRLRESRQIGDFIDETPEQSKLRSSNR
jgi:hypothetical protein